MLQTIIHRWLKRPYLTKGLWQPLHGKFPDEVRVIGLDLLGFGDADNREATVAAAQFLQKTGLAPRSLELNHRTIQPYIASLRASIIKQSLCDEVASLQMPSVFLCGRFDPLVRPKTLEQLRKTNAHITIQRVMASHGLSGGYLRRIAHIISDAAGEWA